MAIADRHGLPVAVHVDSATPHEVTLVRRRWKVERLFAWLQNYRRIVVRYERQVENFLGMLHLACCLILLRCL
jgi:transposase